MGVYSLDESVCVLVNEAFEDGHEDDFDVQPQGPVFDIVQIMLNTLLKISITTPAVDLSPSGNACFNLVFLHIAWDLILELVNKYWALRTGAYDRHVAF